MSDQSSKEQLSINFIAREIGELVEQKNKDYGDAFVKVAEALKILYPDGISPEQYQDVAVLIRVFDKMMRISHGASTEDPWKDIAGYGILMDWYNKKTTGSSSLSGEKPPISKKHIKCPDNCIATFCQIEATCQICFKSLLHNHIFIDTKTKKWCHPECYDKTFNQS